MTTQTVTHSPPPLSPALIIPPRLLITATSTVDQFSPAGDLAPPSLTLRATTTSVLLTDILAQTGFHHGGLNE
jgi:hypothetical protein